MRENELLILVIKRKRQFRLNCKLLQKIQIFNIFYRFIFIYFIIYKIMKKLILNLILLHFSNYIKFIKY